MDASQSLKEVIMILCGTDVDMWTFILRKTYVQDGMGCELPWLCLRFGEFQAFLQELWGCYSLGFV